MRKYLLLLLLICCLTGTAKNKMVRVTTVNGGVYVGLLEEFKPFEKIVMIIDGKHIMIQYKDMAYIDEIKSPTPIAEKKSQRQDIAQRKRKKIRSRLQKK